MKKAILLISIITLFFAGCKKDDIAEASKLRIIETETIEKGWDYVKINVEYDYPVALEAVTLYLSEKEDMSGAEAYECNVEGKKFSVEVKGLKAGVAYYYCYEYDNGYEKVRCDVGGLMIITTKDVTNIKTHSAICGGNIIYYGDDEITVRGVCWSTLPNPTINDNKTTDGSGTGSYTSNLSNLASQTTYYVRAYVTNEVGTVYGEEVSFTTLEGTFENGHEYVDLGLPSGLLWATCNVGATTPEEYGDYFAWGETTTKSDYSSSNCPTYGLSISQLQSQGYIDSEGNLTSQYDAATANWGGNWRMPTSAEQEELLNNCTWTRTTYNGVKGYNVEGPNGNSIFLPAAGVYYGSSLDNAGSNGYDWSSTPGRSISSHACGLIFLSDNHTGYYGSRGNGLSVRPVVE